MDGTDVFRGKPNFALARAGESLNQHFMCYSFGRSNFFNSTNTLKCSVGNGAMAILAGILAQVLEDYLGHIGPFQGAIALTAIALVLILQWEENYGEAQKGEHESSSLYKQFTDGWKLVASDSKVFRIGLIQALSEGGIYTVSYWQMIDLLYLSWKHLLAIGPRQRCLSYATQHHSFCCFEVCVHVGPNPVINEPYWRCSNGLCVFCSHDGHYHRWNCIPAARALLCD